MTNDSNTPPLWWGDFRLDNEQGRLWRIGPLTLIVRCLSDEWQIGHQRTDDRLDAETVWETSDTDQLPETPENTWRYIFQQTTGLLNVAPLMADRPNVSRPRAPFYLSAGEEARSMSARHCGCD